MARPKKTRKKTVDAFRHRSITRARAARSPRRKQYIFPYNSCSHLETVRSIAFHGARH